MPSAGMGFKHYLPKLYGVLVPMKYMYTHTLFVYCAGGAPGAIPERIFVSAGTQVKAFTKKGKQFLSFDSNLAEPIRNMYAYACVCVCVCVCLCALHALSYIATCSSRLPCTTCMLAYFLLSHWVCLLFVLLKSQSTRV